MDPLSVLGVVVNVLAVVDFSFKVAGAGKKIYQNGTLDEHSDLRSLGDDVQRATKVLRDSISSTANGSSHQSTGDEHLLSLASEAAAIGTKLSSLIDGVYGGKGTAGSKRQAAAATMRTLWTHSDIETTEKRLLRVRDELLFSIVVDLRRTINLAAYDQTKQLQTLDSRTQRILLTALDDKVSLESLIGSLSESDRRAEARHEELLLALRRDSRPQKSQTWKSTDEEKDLARRELQALGTILTYVRYSGMEDRQESISPAHENTLKWIFRDPVSSKKPWDDFSKFLKHGHGLYWISGKAGSGKSTLMKYIQRSPQTLQLVEWRSASHRPHVVQASFYFYYHGPDKQKSEIGLLETLLSQILQAPLPQEVRIAMVRYAFPDAFKRLVAKPSATWMQPSKWQLRRALQDLVSQCKDVRFFFIVDGLDELDGSASDMAQLVSYFSKLAEYSWVKIVLSSRPLQVFEDSLSRYPKLRVQDLTHDDIIIYVKDKLYAHPRMERLMKREQQSAQALVLDIVTASSGVFLWVALVIISLLEGLDSGDDVDDLRQRLKELPTELNDFYLTMLKRVPARYRHQTARLLHLVQFGTQSATKMSALELWYALEVDAETLFKTPISPLSEEEEAEALDDLARRVKSRCFGMIELHITERRPFVEETDDLAIDTQFDAYSCDGGKHVQTARFIHRSVTEFLQQPEIWAQFVQDETTADSDFDPVKAILISAIYRIKRLRFVNSHEMVDTLREMILYAAFRVRLSEEYTKLAQNGFVEHLDTSVRDLIAQNVYTLSPQPYGPSEECLKSCGILKAIRKQHWSAIFYTRDLQPVQTNSLLTFAVSNGWLRWIRDQRLRSGSAFRNNYGWPLILFIAHGYFPRVRHNDVGWAQDGWIRKSMLRFLVDNGCLPAETFEGKTMLAWHAEYHREDGTHEEEIRLLLGGKPRAKPTLPIIPDPPPKQFIPISSAYSELHVAGNPRLKEDSPVKGFQAQEEPERRKECANCLGGQCSIL